MISTLYGFKSNQTRVFNEAGTQIYVTQITIPSCVVTNIQTDEAKTTYKLGISTAKKLNKAQAEELKQAGIEKKPRFFREVTESTNDEAIVVGGEISVDQVFAVGDRVVVTGVSKGKGFAGGVKRHGFNGGPKTHGQGDRWRAPGSIGAGTTPGRVYKGQRMAGRMGNQTVSVKGLQVIAINVEKGVMSVSGPVPGSRNGFVTIRKQA
jgi:large subunit ribosomal protein L3